MMTKKDLRRAAYHLKQWADVLHNSHKNGGTGESVAVLAEADEMADLSKQLYALARENKRASKC